MKFLICTLPLRENASQFPPLAIIRLIKSLEESGYNDIDFLNLDFLRYTEEQIIEYVRKSNPDIIGISAVVSTSYRYTKFLSYVLRKILPV